MRHVTLPELKDLLQQSEEKTRTAFKTDLLEALSAQETKLKKQIKIDLNDSERRILRYISEGGKSADSADTETLADCMKKIEANITNVVGAYRQATLEGFKAVNQDARVHASGLHSIMTSIDNKVNELRGITAMDIGRSGPHFPALLPSSASIVELKDHEA